MTSFEEHKPITLMRDCEAVLIPSGTPLELPEGSVVFITQALGGSYTVNINGNLARIAAKDADALGFDVDEENSNTQNIDDASLEDMVWNQLRTCYDPEIPINIVDLGLIYNCEITPQENGESNVDIVMTLTAPGCGMGQFLAEDVRSKISALPKVERVNVELTFDPPWDQSMMSEAARLETGLY